MASTEKSEQQSKTDHARGTVVGVVLAKLVKAAVRKVFGVEVKDLFPGKSNDNDQGSKPKDQ